MATTGAAEDGEVVGGSASAVSGAERFAFSVGALILAGSEAAENPSDGLATDGCRVGGGFPAAVFGTSCVDCTVTVGGLPAKVMDGGIESISLGNEAGMLDARSGEAAGVFRVAGSGFCVVAGERGLVVVSVTRACSGLSGRELAADGGVSSSRFANPGTVSISDVG